MNKVIPLELVTRADTALTKSVAADLLIPDPTEVFSVIIQAGEVEVKKDPDEKSEDQ